MLNELVEHIEVYSTEKIDGVRAQRFVIYYNCIGSIDIPDDIPIPKPEIIMNTRKVVDFLYMPQNTSVTAYAQ